jgi:hypothetical protein
MRKTWGIKRGIGKSEKGNYCDKTDSYGAFVNPLPGTIYEGGNVRINAPNLG